MLENLKIFIEFKKFHSLYTRHDFAYQKSHFFPKDIFQISILNQPNYEFKFWNGNLLFFKTNTNNSPLYFGKKQKFINNLQPYKIIHKQFATIQTRQKFWSRNLLFFETTPTIPWLCLKEQKFIKQFAAIQNETSIHGYRCLLN